MAMNLETVLKIKAQVDGTQSLRGFSKALDDAGKAAEGAGQGFKKVLNAPLFRAAAVAAAALGTALAVSTSKAIDFESAMADVKKVVDGLDTPESLADIRQEIIDLSSSMPIAADGFAAIYEAAGQSGVARDELKGFAESVAKVAIAFDMTADEAGTAMAKIQTSLGLDLDELNNLTDAMNHLSNNSASTADELVKFTLKGGQAGQMAGLTAEQTAAFGSAMIAAGAQVDVAATSFRNMITTLASGEAMTDPQIQALVDLGYEIDDAVLKEQEFTDAVRQQSADRIDAARNETDELAKELSRRYRDQMRSIQDNFEDESDAFTEQVQDKAEAQIQALRSQERREIEAANARAKGSQGAARAELDKIREFYAQKIDSIRDNARDELKVFRRASRDRLTDIRDDMNDRKEVELDALESNFDEIQAREKKLMQERVDQIKLQAKEGAVAAAKALSEGLQQDAVGTITDVFDRINQLPRAEQLTVLQELFGKEARAILPLVNNSELLEKSLGLVGDQADYAGSTLQEYLTRTETTANKIQLAKNNIDNLAITFGENFAPALSALADALSPVIQAFTWLINNVPGLGPALALLTGAFVGLVVVLPALGALQGIVVALGGMGTILATIGGYLGAVVPVLGSIVAFIGPQGLIALGVIAVGALLYTFRDQIGEVFNGISETLTTLAAGLYDIFVQPFIDGFNVVITWLADSWAGITDLLSEPFQSFVEWLQENFIEPIIDFLGGAVETLAGAWEALSEALTAPFDSALEFIDSSFVQPISTTISNAVDNLREFWGNLTEALQNPFKNALDFVNKKFIEPMQSVIEDAISFVVDNWTAIQEGLTAPFTAAAEIIKGVLNSVIESVETTINSVIRAVNSLIRGVNNIASSVGLPSIPTIGLVELPRFADGGVVDGPTMAIVGEGGEPEYIIPASKADGFAANWMSGIRGPAAIPRFADGGMVAPSNANVSIQTGPVTQMNGNNYVTTQDMTAAVQAGVKQTLDLIRRDGNTRASLGIA
jgi:TP901 family phage tail tape measure protein|tara:strand:- start:355 stop:3381 length:3027 start_codon:yes stop_codon:yes gene_type:complete